MKKKQWEEEFSIVYDLLTGTPRPKGYIKKELIKHVSQELDQARKEEHKKIIQRVGFLRQWINETNKPITSEQIMEWLKLI